MARGQPWVPGVRVPKMQRRRSFPLLRILSAELERIAVRVSRFNFSDEEVTRVTDQGFTPEVQEQNVLLSIQRDQTTLSINLANLTEEELDVFVEAVQFAIDTARPVIQARDTVAKEAYQDGDGTYRRLHRGSPKISYIQRKESSDDQVVRERPGDVLPGHGQD